MITCPPCNQHCKQGRTCPAVVGAKAAAPVVPPTVPQPAPESRGWFVPAHAEDHLDMWNDWQKPSHPATHLQTRKDDVAPFAFSSPGALEAAAGPEPMLPAPRWVNALGLALAAAAVCAAVGITAGMHWPQIQTALAVFARLAGLG